MFIGYWMVPSAGSASVSCRRCGASSSSSRGMGEWGQISGGSWCPGPVPGSGPSQPEPVLGGPASLADAVVVVPEAGPYSVLASQHRHDVDVIRGVADRDPSDRVVLAVGASPVRCRMSRRSEPTRRRRTSGHWGLTCPAPCGTRAATAAKTAPACRLPPTCPAWWPYGTPRTRTARGCWSQPPSGGPSCVA